ncbi:hypothetical protein D1007_04518 [Hordeum vulgare]|nr:hypothetical protein D1007_04518 [Hordeum vulgare]
MFSSNPRIFFFCFLCYADLRNNCPAVLLSLVVRSASYIQYTAFPVVSDLITSPSPERGGEEVVCARDGVSGEQAQQHRIRRHGGRGGGEGPQEGPRIHRAVRSGGLRLPARLRRVPLLPRCLPDPPFRHLDRSPVAVCFWTRCV